MEGGQACSRLPVVGGQKEAANRWRSVVGGQSSPVAGCQKYAGGQQAANICIGLPKHTPTFLEQIPSEHSTSDCHVFTAYFGKHMPIFTPRWPTSPKMGEMCPNLVVSAIVQIRRRSQVAPVPLT